MAGIGGTPTFALGTMASGMPKKPTNPTALSAIANPDSSNRKRVSLSWTAPVNTGFPAVTSYNVEIVGVTTITGITGTSTTWSSGTINTNYQFKVYAVNSAGTSVASNTANATVTDVPDTTTVSVNNTTTFGSMILSWSAPAYTGSSAITGYVVSVDGVGNIYSGSGTSYTWTGGSKGSSYNFRIIASNSAGNSATSGAVASTVQGNVATGGSVSDISNYNGTGQTWRVHTFTGNSAFIPSVSTSTYRMLLVGAGRDGGRGTYGGSGGSGGNIYDTTVSITTGSNTVNIGQTNGAATTLGAYSSNSGGIPGSGGGGGGLGPGNAGGQGSSTNISGSTVFYGGGGGGGGGPEGDWSCNNVGGAGGNRGGGAGGRGRGCGDRPNNWPTSPGDPGGTNTGGGGGGGGGADRAGETNGLGGAGGSGIAIVSYRLT